MTRKSKSESVDVSPAADCTILGGGPIGCLAALALAARLPDSAHIRLITGRRLPPEDGRAAALIGRSVSILEGLGLADTFVRQGAPLAAIRIIDVTGRLVRAPTTLFCASDSGRDSFGISLTTRNIVDLFRQAIRERGRVEILEVDILSMARDGEGFRLTDDAGGEHAASFLVAADGQRSMAREMASIPVKRWTYPQMALTFAVSHSRDHEDISTEFHTSDGPFTLVPSGDRCSTVVWMTNPEEGQRLLAMDDPEFAHEAERICRSMLGKFTLVSPRGSYPMGGLVAERFTAPGLALVGESGHAFPPIGAQGMNLGFRDCDTLAEACGRAFNAAPAAGQPSLDWRNLADWDHNRQRDIKLTTAGVDAFNRSLLSDFLPVAMGRTAALAALKAIPPLRRALMRAGLSE